MTNSRAKGKRGELELAHKLRDYGYDTRRTAQSCGKFGTADVEGLPYIHCEVKRNEKLNVYDAIEQAKRDHAEGTTPAVFWRKNDHNWLVTMELSDWIRLYREWEAAHEEG